MKSIRSVTILLGLLIGSGCSLPKIPAPVVREQVYPRPRAEVWAAALNTLRQQDVIVNTSDPSSGILTYTTILDEDTLKQAILQKDLDAVQGAAYTTVFVQEKGQEATKVHAHTKVRVPPFGALLSSGGAIERKLFAGLSAQLGSSPVSEPVVRSFIPAVTSRPQASPLESVGAQEARMPAGSTVLQSESQPATDTLSARSAVPSAPPAALFEQHACQRIAELRTRFPKLYVHQREQTVVFRGHVPHHAAFQEVTRLADELTQEFGVVTVIEVSFTHER